MAAVKFAVIDVNDFLTKKQTSDPSLSSEWAKLEELYNKKLWHQLTLNLLDLVKRPSLQQGDNLIQLYNNFLTTFENKINPLSLIEIVAYIIQQFTDKKEAIAFLEKMEPKVKANDEALALCKVLQGQIHLEQLNDLDATEKVIDHLENTLEDADGVTPVHGRFYKLASDYYKVRGPISRYYRATLRYVGCCGGGADLSPAERKEAALQLAKAALIAPDVYDLGELMVHPILESLDNTPESWARLAVSAAARGDSAALDQLTARNNQAANLLNEHATVLRQKIAILATMELAFNRTTSRKLTFAEIAKAARIPLDDVELLLMKALAEKLIKGHIDQVQATAHISWVRPRALGREEAAALCSRVHAWRTAVQNAHLLLTDHASDVFVA